MDTMGYCHRGTHRPAVHHDTLLIYTCRVSSEKGWHGHMSTQCSRGERRKDEAEEVTEERVTESILKLIKPPIHKI
jgi:hypothetical protein